jgi:hypothetical protein
MRARLRWTIVVAITAAPTGCELLVDTAGLSGGSDAGSPAEADGGVPTDGADAPADGPLTDADAADAGGGPSVVQRAGHPAQNVTSLSLSLALPVGPRAALVLLVATSSSDPVSVAGGGASWTKRVSAGQHVATSLWLGLGPSGNGDVTSTFAGNQAEATALLTEWADLGGLRSSVTQSGIGTAISTASLDGVSGETLLAVVGMHNHSVGAPTNGFTEIGSVGIADTQLLVAFKGDGSSGPFTTGWTASTADGWDALLATLTRMP